MKAILLLLPAMVVSAPAHALSIVSLHAGMTAPFSTNAVDITLVFAGVLALAAAIGYRVFRH